MPRRRTNLDRLRAAAERRYARGPFQSREDRTKAERRAQAELLALLDSIENGDPVTGRSNALPLSAEEGRSLDDVLAMLCERRNEVIETAAMLRDSGYENDLTRLVEDAGLMPQEPLDGG